MKFQIYRNCVFTDAAICDMLCTVGASLKGGLWNMSLGARLREARRAKGFTQKELAQRVGARHNSISNWEKGLNVPGLAVIERLCAVLDVTPNDLYCIGGVPAHAHAPHPPFSTGESEIIRKYRALDAEGRGAVDALLDYYAGRAVASAARGRDMRPERLSGAPVLEVLPGLISTQSVAAGTGTYLDADSFEGITVARNAQTQRAAFYVPVQGDSMEPKFYDGDILMIERTGVKKGEIGVFTLENYGYVKMLGEGELLSLNPDYAPIPMREDILCNGKVIGVLDPEWIVG